jgi:hypothetical protein
MNYQDLVNIIRDTANLVNPTGLFVHARRTDGSLEYDKNFPQIHLYPVRSELELNNENVRHNIILMFWDQDRPETTNEEREAIIAAMDDLSNLFLFTLNANTNVSLSNVLKTPEYRQLAATASGYGLSFTISSKINCDV